METLTHIKSLANPNYIGSYELMTSDTPIELVVTIEKIVKELVQNGEKKEFCTVMYIAGQKPMILNSTNRKAVIKATGTTFIERMVGKRVTLYVSKIMAFGEACDALRIRKEAPVSAPAKMKPELSPGHEKWDGALKAMQEQATTIEAIKKTYSISPENELLLTTPDPEMV